MAQLRWRQCPRPTGLAGTAAAGRYQGMELRQGEQVLATVGFDRYRDAYYWYGSGHNSLWSDVTYDTPEAACAAAKAYVQAKLASEAEEPH